MIRADVHFVFLLNFGWRKFICSRVLYYADPPAIATPVDQEKVAWMKWFNQLSHPSREAFSLPMDG